MRNTLLAFAVLLGAAVNAQAEVLEVPDMPSTSSVSTPARGQSMASVSRDFGEPEMRHPAAGGGSRLHPPITRWDYPAFSVFFERDTVIDIVVKGAQMPISNLDELKAASP